MTHPYEWRNNVLWIGDLMFAAVLAPVDKGNPFTLRVLDVGNLTLRFHSTHSTERFCKMAGDVLAENFIRATALTGFHYLGIEGLGLKREQE